MSAAFCSGFLAPLKHNYISFPLIMVWKKNFVCKRLSNLAEYFMFCLQRRFTLQTHQTLVIFFCCKLTLNFFHLLAVTCYMKVLHIKLLLYFNYVHFRARLSVFRNFVMYTFLSKRDFILTIKRENDCLIFLHLVFIIIQVFDSFWSFIVFFSFIINASIIFMPLLL